MTWAELWILVKKSKEIQPTRNIYNILVHYWKLIFVGLSVIQLVSEKWSSFHYIVFM